MPSLAELRALDDADPLASFRDLFALPDGMIYLDGNSLGPLPRATPARIAEVVTREWGEGLIRSWNSACWMEMPARVGDKIAQLIGAAPGSVIAGDSTSVNVFKLLAAALALRPARASILSEWANFPSDRYVAEGLCATLDRGHSLRLVDAAGIEAALDADVAVARLTRAAHAAGALVLWDLAHSAGAVPLDLAGDDVDLAVGCGYKFLNGGPGAPAFLYVAPRLQETLPLPITGWLGHAAPFAFETHYRPAPGIARAVVGTPAVLGLAALEVGVDIARAAPIQAVREKSLRLSALFADLVEQECPGAFTLLSPRDDAGRGSQVCLAHPDGYAIVQALIERGVIGDFRTPDILRFGITPLTLRYADLWRAVSVLRDVMASGEWRASKFQVRQAVT